MRIGAGILLEFEMTVARHPLRQWLWEVFKAPPSNYSRRRQTLEAVCFAALFGMTWGAVLVRDPAFLVHWPRIGNRFWIPGIPATVLMAVAWFKGRQVSTGRLRILEKGDPGDLRTWSEHQARIGRRNLIIYVAVQTQFLIFGHIPLTAFCQLLASVGFCYCLSITLFAMRLEKLTAETRDQARDQALRSKLAPHFIFNTLNTLQAQITSDPRGAAVTTERLAQLFRQVVQVADQFTIPLRQELDFVEAYLGIEKARMGERLRVEIDVPEELEEVGIPPLSLQVLVENAVKHGVAPLEAGGLIRIKARKCESGALRLSVLDSGTGNGGESGTGTALATLRQRLSNPNDLELRRTDDGFCATFDWSYA